MYDNIVIYNDTVNNYYNRIYLDCVYTIATHCTVYLVETSDRNYILVKTHTFDRTFCQNVRLSQKTSSRNNMFAFPSYQRPRSLCNDVLYYREDASCNNDIGLFC